MMHDKEEHTMTGKTGTYNNEQDLGWVAKIASEASDFCAGSGSRLWGRNGVDWWGDGSPLTAQFRPL